MLITQVHRKNENVLLQDFTVFRQIIFNELFLQFCCIHGSIELSTNRESVPPTSLSCTSLPEPWFHFPFFLPFSIVQQSFYNLQPQISSLSHIVKSLLNNWERKERRKMKSRFWKRSTWQRIGGNAFAIGRKIIGSMNTTDCKINSLRIIWRKTVKSCSNKLSFFWWTWVIIGWLRSFSTLETCYQSQSQIQHHWEHVSSDSAVCNLMAMGMYPIPLE